MGKKFVKNLIGILCLLAGGINLFGGVSQMNIIVILTGVFFTIGGVMYLKQARNIK